jgi:hypothetical protein
VNQDNNRNKNATKHYQNSDYPSGSFEAAINGDHQERLRETSGLRLERHPLAPGNSGADLEEMVPAFMHRDFFRSEEDAVEGVTPSSRLRTARKEAPAPQSYMEPPNTEEASPRPAPVRPSVPLATEPSPYAPPAQAEEPKAEQPKPSAQTEQPLPPLRASVAPAGPAPDLRSRPASETPASATYPPTVVAAQPEHASSRSPYSIPMLVALALVMGIFVWREQTRPLVAVQEPLSVPKTVQSPAAPVPVAEPTAVGTAFRPTYLAVGPPIPQNRQAAPTPASSEQQDASLFPGQEGQQGQEAATTEALSEEEVADRAAILERMSQVSAEGESSPPEGEPGELFPTTDEAAAPVRVKASAPKSEAKAEPKAAPKAAPAPVSASAADLFPIDEEIPIKPGKAKAAAAAPPPSEPAAVVQPPAQPVAPPPDGYRIDEPSL